MQVMNLILRNRHNTNSSQVPWSTDGSRLASFTRVPARLSHKSTDEEYIGRHTAELEAADREDEEQKRAFSENSRRVAAKSNVKSGEWAARGSIESQTPLSGGDHRFSQTLPSPPPSLSDPAIIFSKPKKTSSAIKITDAQGNAIYFSKPPPTPTTSAQSRAPVIVSSPEAPTPPLRAPYSRAGP